MQMKIKMESGEEIAIVENNMDDDDDDEAYQPRPSKRFASAQNSQKSFQQSSTARKSLESEARQLLNLKMPFPASTSSSSKVAAVVPQAAPR